MQQPTHPAQLWIGNHAHLVAYTQQYLKKLWCKQNSCNSCVTCHQINTQQHYSTMWLLPEKQYTVEHLEPIFSTISFALASEQHYFFIIQKADLLTPTCANSLLKSIEEPPHGYHFILLAERLDQILPTIRSRCVLELLHSAAQPTTHPLVVQLQNLPNINALQCMKELESTTPTEHESMQLIDALLKHWTSVYKQAITAEHKEHAILAHRIVAVLQNSLEMPPMPGSSKIFWKNLFLQLASTT